MGLFTNQVAVGLISGVVASAVTLTAAAFGYWNKDRELDIEMVRVSLSILAGENKETSLQGRQFALKALEKYSRVDIPDDQEKTWAASGTVPLIPFQPIDIRKLLDGIRKGAEEREAKEAVPDAP